MRKFFRWVRRDSEGQARIEVAKRENREIAERIAREVNEDQSKIAWIRRTRKVNHLAELFDDAFGMGRE